MPADVSFESRLVPLSFVHATRAELARAQLKSFIEQRGNETRDFLDLRMAKTKVRERRFVCNGPCFLTKDADFIVSVLDCLRFQVMDREMMRTGVCDTVNSMMTGSVLTSAHKPRKSCRSASKGTGGAGVVVGVLGVN